jgi:hypothetical protein
MQISGVSLALTWPGRLCLLSPVCKQLLQAFPCPSTLGEVTLHLLSQACVFIYSSCGKWVFPPLLWTFPPSTTFTSFPASGCWACAAAPAFSGQLIYSSVKVSPPPRFGAHSTPPCLLCVFFFLLLLIIQFFFFPWVGVGLSRGRLADLVPVSPSHLGVGIWPQRGSPPGFSL